MYENILNSEYILATLSNILSVVTWVFPLLSLALLSYCIEYYTKYKTYWKIYFISVLLAAAYPLGSSYYIVTYGDTPDDMELIFNMLLLAGTILAAYASVELMKFQQIDLGRTKETVIALIAASMFIPFAAIIAGLTTVMNAWSLCAHNLSYTSMTLIFLAIGKLTQNYVPRYRMLTYSSARLGAIVLLTSPILLTYVDLTGQGLAVRHAARIVGLATQSLATLLLFVTVVLMITEAQARGVHLIPLRERKDTKPMKYTFQKGYGYLIQEDNSAKTTEMFIEYVTHQHNGLLLTRTQPSRVRQNFGLRTTPILWMTNAATDEKSVKPQDMDRIVYIIKDFIRFDTDSIVLIQRLDYLITENDFNSVLRLIHSLNDLVTTSKCVLLVSIDPSTLSRERLALLTQELEDITNADKTALGEPLYSVLLFVHTENARRRMPSFKSITKKFMITKTTARKRIGELETKGLLRILTEGRYKFLEVTEKGRAVVASPAGIQGGFGDGGEE